MNKNILKIAILATLIGSVAHASGFNWRTNPTFIRDIGDSRLHRTIDTETGIICYYVEDIYSTNNIALSCVESSKYTIRNAGGNVND